MSRQFTGRRVEAFVVPACNDDGCTQLRQGDGDPETDSTTAAGDDRDRARELQSLESECMMGFLR